MKEVRKEKKNDHALKWQKNSHDKGIMDLT